MDFHNQFSYTILQANSIGLEVEKALPCHCEDIAEFEDPSQIPCADNFVLNNAQINGGTGTAKLFGKIVGNDNLIAKIVLKNNLGLVEDSTLIDQNGEWELKNVPANTFTLNLDATNKFPAIEFEVVEGSKEQTIVVHNDDVLEVNLTLNKL